MTAIDDDLESDLYRAQSKFVGELKRIAVQNDIAILLVAHPRKTNGSITNDDVSGSGDITNKVDIVMSYERVEDDESCDGKLSITKNRLFGNYAIGDKRIDLYYSQATKRITSAASVKRNYGWENTETEKEEFDDLPF